MGPWLRWLNRTLSRSTRSIAIRWWSSRRPGYRACAWTGRRAIATCRIFTGSRRSESNGCKINALDLAERGQKPLGQLASAFSGSLLGTQPRRRAILIRDAAPISSLLRGCCLPAVGGAARGGAGLPGRRRVDPHGGAHASAGAESACRQRRLVQASEADRRLSARPYRPSSGFTPRASGTLQAAVRQLQGPD